VYHNDFGKFKMLPLEGLFSKTSKKNDVRISENIPFFVWRNLANTYSTKRNETKRNETKRNETKRNETKRNETKRNETKRNETKRNETKRVKKR